VTFYDADFDEEDGPTGSESRDDFLMLFVGPNPEAIMQVQRDLLVQDVIGLMERHFDGAELSGVVAEVDKLFAQRFDALVNSLDSGKTAQRIWWQPWWWAWWWRTQAASFALMQEIRMKPFQGAFLTAIAFQAK
jgi:hypothetical protein